MRISDWSSDVCSSDLAAFTALGARLQPLAVDGQGLDPAQLAALSPAPRLAMLTPSHQFPLGMTLPLARRLARSEEHTSELQSLMRISYAVFCLKKKTTK